MRKQFIDSYDAKLNNTLQFYFEEAKSKQKSHTSGDEPANISSGMLKVVDIIHNQVFKDLGLTQFSKVKQKISVNLGQFLELVEVIDKPDMISPIGKATQIEMDMDKFLAKKSAIYNKVIF